MNDGSKDFILFSIGPVQSFISASRRTQDLAAASRLLSWLVHQALKSAAEQGGEVIFPFLPSTALTASLPNRVVIHCPSGRGEQIAKNMESHVRNLLDGLGNQIKQYLSRTNPPPRGGENGFWDGAAVSQLHEFLECYWIVSTWDGVSENYSDAFRKASLQLDGRKSLRHIPLTFQPDLKCSLCGIRSALGGKQAEQTWRRHPLLSRQVKGGERLCAVCSLRRFGKQAGLVAMEEIDRFPSTSSIAVNSFRAAVAANWEVCGNAAGEFLKQLKKLGLGLNLIDPQMVLDEFLRLDGDFFFQDYFHSKRIDDDLRRTLSVEERMNTLTKQKELLQAVENCRPSEGWPPGQSPFPNSYFSVLAMDGDRMGALLDKTLSIDEHRKISEALYKASVKMTEIVAEFQGKMIYCGGDDALALLPVGSVLPAASTLRKIFRDELEAEGFSGCHASVGIVIVHHQFSLQKALNSARELLYEAKESYNRDALAARILLRSGAPRQAGMHWNDEAIERLDDVRKRLVDGRLSGRFAYEFKEEAPALPYMGRKIELERLIRRHSPPDQRAEAGRIAEQLEMITSLVEGLEDTPAYNEELAEWLVMMRFLAQGERL